MAFKGKPVPNPTEPPGKGRELESVVGAPPSRGNAPSTKQRLHSSAVLCILNNRSLCRSPEKQQDLQIKRKHLQISILLLKKAVISLSFAKPPPL